MSESQKYTDAKKNGNRKWDAANLDRISIAVSKGRKEEIKTHAEAHGESVNGFINRAIETVMEWDKGIPGAILSPDTQQAAQTAAQAAGETVPEFIARAVDTQAQRDKLTRSIKNKE